MELNVLTAISPIDGRYRNQVEQLSTYFSEESLIRYRVKVEVEYFIALCQLPLPQLTNFKTNHFNSLRDLYLSFKTADAIRIKEIEKITNHDVKAVEYFLKEHFDRLGISEYKEFIHFGLTSQDINNTAIPLSLAEATKQVLLPAIDDVISKLDELSVLWKDVSMLAKTHGQAASPTRLGKEIMVFSVRIKNQKEQLINQVYPAKFGGATGNFNAHLVAYPNIDWNNFANLFVNTTLGLSRSYPTTQIEHYDHLASLFDVLKRINTIFLDLNRDMWTYISMNYFKQKIKEGEIGSSAMPHKVNPIDFENSEGNIGIANAIFEHLSAKLPVSRLQRDLTDSTVLRNIGVPFAHTLIAIKSLLKGLNKIVLNEKAIEQDLNENWAVVAEAIQTILRREAYPNPYEALKELTRTNKPIDQEIISRFIDGLAVGEEIKKELRLITPHTFTGINPVK